MARLPQDENGRNVLGGISSEDPNVIVPIAVNPLTGAVLIDGTSLYSDLDSRYLQISNNLSDLNDVATARTNLGLVAGGTGDIWVEKAGDTMTGNLTLDATTPTIATGTNKNLNLIPNGTGITVVGNAGTTSHTLNTNDDLFVSGRLEVDGTTFFDEGIRITKNGDSFISVNPSGGSFIGGWNTNTTAAQMVLFVDTALGRQLVFGNLNFRLNDFDHATTTNPTMFFHSVTDPDVSNNQWGSLTHDQTNFVITTGANTGAGTGATTIANDIVFSPRGTEVARFTGTGTLTMAEAKDIVLGTTTGTKIGTVGGASGQKLGFFAATPIVQPVLATGAGATADNIITVLQNLGLVRQS